MHQTGTRAVAPTNPEPRWPEGSVAALRADGPREKTIPYWVGWVGGLFARRPGRRRRGLGRAEIEAFRAGMAARNRVNNWPVHPAFV
jgi:hypothetical protein